MISAMYFDGRSARKHQMELAIADGQLKLGNAELSKQYALADARLVEPFAGAPLVLHFADGAHCEVADAADKQAVCKAMAFRKTLVMRLQERWGAALCAVVALCAVLFATVEWGIPAAAERIVSWAPAALDTALGRQTLIALDKDLMKPSRLSDQRLAEVQAIFDDIKPAAPRQPLRLLFRSVQIAGPNAFALPDGTIVMTDAMVLRVLDEDDEIEQFGRHQLAGVLAHEIGHVQGRHSMRALARSSLTVALAATLFGDFSAIAAGAPAMLLNAQHSRDMETEADRYAITLLAQHRIPTQPLAALFQGLMEENEGTFSKLPRWMQVSIGYAASHPSTDERIRQLGGTASAGEATH